MWVDLPLAAAAEHFDAIMTSAYSVSMFRDWTRPGLINAVWLKSRSDEPAADLGAWGARPATAKLHPIPGQDPAPATEQFGIPGPWHLRLPHFSPEFAPSVGNEQQSEYFIPREHGPEALAALARLDLARSLYVCEVRTVAADGLWLSPCRDRPTTAIHFTWINDDEAVSASVAAVEAALGHLDVRPHWAKVFRMPPEQVRPHYPDLPRFRDLASLTTLTASSATRSSPATSTADARGELGEGEESAAVVRINLCFSSFSPRVRREPLTRREPPVLRERPNIAEDRRSSITGLAVSGRRQERVRRS